MSFHLLRAAPKAFGDVFFSTLQLQRGSRKNEKTLGGTGPFTIVHATLTHTHRYIYIYIFSDVVDLFVLNKLYDVLRPEFLPSEAGQNKMT